MSDSVTDQNLSLHLKSSALEFYDGSFALRDDESLIIHQFFPSPPCRVLDLGVGNGRTTVPLHKMGYEVVGIEYCEDLVKAGLREHPEVNICHGDARNLQYPDASFDVVLFSSNGIDYMSPYSERTVVLQEIYRVLKPGGHFFVYSHNVLGIIGRLFKPPGLTLQGLQFICSQLTLRRPFFSWYFIWKDQYLGRPLFYSAPPLRQVKALRSQGFDVQHIRSVAHPNRSALWWKDVHVNYICAKHI